MPVTGPAREGWHTPRARGPHRGGSRSPPAASQSRSCIVGGRCATCSCVRGSALRPLLGARSDRRVDLAAAAYAVAMELVLVLLVLGGVVIPRSELPDSVAGVAVVLPSAGLADGLRSALVAGELNASALLVVLGWAVVATVLAARFFRFDD